MHELSVVSNIANAGSTAFKKSDVSFSDLYSTSTPYSVPRTAVGQGSNVHSTRMSDTQGGIMDRGGALNLAIVGAGYFYGFATRCFRCTFRWALFLQEW